MNKGVGGPCLAGSLTGAVALRRYQTSLLPDILSGAVSRGASWLYAGTSEYGIVLISENLYLRTISREVPRSIREAGPLNDYTPSLDLTSGMI